MDKSFGTLYQKISNLFHPNSSSTNSTPETSSTIPIGKFIDRMPSTINTSSPIIQQRSSSRISRQISIKTNENRIQQLDNLPQQQT